MRFTRKPTLLSTIQSGKWTSGISRLLIGLWIIQSTFIALPQPIIELVPSNPADNNCADINSMTPPAGCGVGLPILFFTTIASLTTISKATDCGDYQCDSLRVRAILDSNGLTTTTVASVTTKTGSPLRITTLNLSYKNLTTMPNDIGSLIKLRTLCLQYNAFTTLPDTMRNLTDLKTYQVFGNPNLHSLPDWSTMIKLYSVDCSGCHLDSLPDFGCFDSLAVLKLCGNQLTGIPSSIWKCRNLLLLELHINKLNTLPAGIGNLTKLQILRIDNQGINLTSLPDSMRNLTSLQTYYVSYNPNLHALPSLASMPKLVSFRSARCHLDSLPEFGDCDSLVDFRVDDNAISELPSSIWKCRNLITLYLQGNKLTTLPDGFGNLTKLKHLYLNRQIPSLASIPDTMRNLTELRWLSVDANSALHTLPDWSNMNKLATFNGQNCHLDSLPSFGGFDSLNDFRVYNNQIASIPATINNIKSDIAYLYLYNNQIANLPLEIIDLTPTNLNISGNKLCCLGGTLGNWLDTYDADWESSQECTGIYCDTTSDSLLLVYYNCDAGSGNYLIDSSRYHRDGVIYGATWNDSGVTGKCLEFDGVNDYVDMMTNTIGVPTWNPFGWIGERDFTISAWYKLRNDSSGGYIIGTKGTGFLGECPDVNWVWVSVVNDPFRTDDGDNCNEDKVGRVAFQMSSPTYSPVYTGALVSDTTYSSNDWHHFVALRNLAQMWVDGKKVANLCWNGIYSVFYSGLEGLHHWQIGAEDGLDAGDCPAQPFGGKLDEIRVYGYAMDSSQIVSLYEEFALGKRFTQDRFDKSNNLPETWSLHQNKPNPFNPTTDIYFSIPLKKKGAISYSTTINIYNINGNMIKELVHGTMGPGYYRTAWDGIGNDGKAVSSGVYIYKMESGRFKSVKKMLMTK